MPGYSPGIDFPNFNSHTLASEISIIGNEAIRVIRQLWPALRNRFAESEISTWIMKIDSAIQLMYNARIEPGERRYDLSLRFNASVQNVGAVLSALIQARGPAEVEQVFKAVGAFISAHHTFYEQVIAWVQADPDAFGSYGPGSMLQEQTDAPLTEMDRLVLKVIHDWEYEPYEEIAEIEELRILYEEHGAPKTPITPVPDYLIEAIVGGHHFKKVSPSLQVLLKFGLIEQKAGVYHCGAWRKLTDGSEIKAKWEHVAGPPPGTTVEVYGKDGYSSFSRTTRGTEKPNSYSLTALGIKEARRPMRLTDASKQQVEAPSYSFGSDDRAAQFDELVTLGQVAPLTGLNKRTLERYLQDEKLPRPDFPGGNGKAHKWYWRTIRPALVSLVNRVLPEKFPGSQII